MTENVGLDREALARLLDKDAIRDLVALYARGIDRHDDQILANVYHPDAHDDHGTYIGGIPGLIDHCNAVHEANWTAHQHYALNQLIEFSGETAHVETYFLIALRRKDGVIDLVGGRWIDRAEKRGGKWGIADRVVVLDWNGEANKASAPMDPGLFISGSWDERDISYRRPLRVERPHRANRF
jgi:hypothetical protein